MKISLDCIHPRPYFRHLTKNPFKKKLIDFSAKMLTRFLVLACKNLGCDYSQ